jgi:hypothetical protein
MRSQSQPPCRGPSRNGFLAHFETTFIACFSSAEDHPGHAATMIQLKVRILIGRAIDAS